MSAHRGKPGTFRGRPWALVLLIWVASYAEAAPDVGTLLRERDTAPISEPRQGAQLLIDGAPFDVAPEGGATATIIGFDFTGNDSIDDAELAEALGAQAALPAVLDFAGMLRLAQAAAEFYRGSGYPFAAAVLPPQDLASGRLRIRVLEGRYGRVSAQAPERFVRSAQSYLQPLATGDVIEGQPLERRALVVDGLPSVALTPVVRPGQDVGTGDVEFRIDLERSQQLAVTLDNHGSRFSGAKRMSVAADRFWLLTLGDQLSVRGTVSEEGTWFGSLFYSRPVGISGLAFEASAARSDFTLGGQFDGFGGTADTMTAGFSYPLLLSARTNVYLGIGAEGRWLENDSPVGSDTRRTASGYLETRFDRRDGLGLGGVSYGRLRVSRNRVSGIDELSGTASEGTFARLELVRLQALTDGLTLSLRAVGQWAQKNTDAAADLALGGVHAVRAFPQGEATGDEGFFLQAELRRRLLLEHLSAALFVDHGEIRFNADPLPGQGSNSRSLGAFGLALRYQGQRLSSELIVAERFDGSEPQSDSRDPRPRAWFSLSYRF